MDLLIPEETPEPLLHSCSSLESTSCHLPTMVDLFVDRVLVKNNRDRDELDTEPELLGRLQNRILMLFFGSAACCSCRSFAPTLAHFFRQLTDESYVERSAQLVLLYIRWEPVEPKSTRHMHSTSTGSQQPA